MKKVLKRSSVLGPEAPDAEDSASAIRRLQRAAMEKPKDLSILLDLGNVLSNAGETLRAIEVYGNILQLDPDSGQAWNNLGNILSSLNDNDAALSCFRNAVRLLPNEPISQYSLGRALSLLGREKEALEHLSQACTLNPDHADAWLTLGNVHQYLGHWDAALHCFGQALVLSPEWAEPHVSRAVVLLNQGDFRAGWPEYEYRWETPAFRMYKERPFESRQWRGEPLQGKSILLFAEQGFGDAIQFARFIPLIRAHGAEVFLELRAPLLELFRQLVEPDHVLLAGGPRPATAFHCSFLSLPGVLGVDFRSIPNHPYLTVPRTKTDAASAVLQSLAKDPTSLRVGLLWKGNPSHRWDFKRSLNLAQLAPLAQVPGIQWYCLQADATAQELSEWPQQSTLAVLPKEHLDGFEQVAAIAQALDLVLSVDTAYAHLAGALGKPVWLLLSLFYEWRWHSDLEDSPWYPSAQLFRQDEPGQWAGAIERLAKSLLELASSKRVVR